MSAGVLCDLHTSLLRVLANTKIFCDLILSVLDSSANWGRSCSKRSCEEIISISLC